MSKVRKTRMIHSGRGEGGSICLVNLSVMRARTIIFDSIATWRDARSRRETERLLSYGARGTETAFALEELVTGLQGGYRAQLFPSELAAITVTTMSNAHCGGTRIFPV
ncbi:PLP-dependent transferase [Salmonella enterica]|nr:PLP-dependent transferase [Salmonella enterica]